MDIKTRKRIQVFKDRLRNRRHREVAARRPPDEPDEPEQAEREILGSEKD